MPKTMDIRTKVRKIKEFIIERMIFLSAILSIIIVALIFAFLLKEGLSISGEFLFPIFYSHKIGIQFPILLNSESCH